MNDCLRTIATCPNLQSLICIVPNVLPSFVLALQEKKNLEFLRINGALTTSQADLLTKVTGLRSLTIDGGTWNVVDVLPRWMGALKPTLTSLTLYVRDRHS